MCRTKSGKLRRVMKDEEVPLLGLHNRMNVAACATVGMVMRIAPDVIRAGIMGFRGLPHRMEFVKEWRGVMFYNNSMCTNPRAFVCSVSAFGEKVIVIAGGRIKNTGLHPIVDAIVEWAKGAVLIGESAESIAQELKAKGYTSFKIADSMECAVLLAKGMAHSGDKVILAPGGASFDWYTNFAERGEDFKRIVEALDE